MGLRELRIFQFVCDGDVDCGSHRIIYAENQEAAEKRIRNLVLNRWTKTEKGWICGRSDRHHKERKT